jgi:hypothetical protein
MKSAIIPCAFDHLTTHCLSSGQVLADLQEGLLRKQIYKHMILIAFYHSSDHFRSFLPILSIREQNFIARSPSTSIYNQMKYLYKNEAAEFGTPFA